MGALPLFKEDQRHFYRSVLFIPSGVIGEKGQKGGRTDTGSCLGKTEEMGHCPRQQGQEQTVEDKPERHHE